MSINKLYNDSIDGGEAEEKLFFKFLTERFMLVAEQKIQNHQDCQEVVQNALMAVLKKYKDMHFEISFSAWAYDVLKKEILKYYRTKSTRAQRFTGEGDDFINARLKSIDPALREDLINCMRKICTANLRFARILNLKYQGYDVEEICRRLEVNMNNMYVILSRARSTLKLCLETGSIK